jgi:hypothetical protein
MAYGCFPEVYEMPVDEPDDDDAFATPDPDGEGVTLHFPGGVTVIKKPSRETALQSAKEWIALARASTDPVYIASALDKAAAALELL